MLKLPVPYLSQGDSANLCVPVCLKMVIDYLKEATGDPKIPSFSVRQISKIVRTKSGGTDFPDVEEINERLEKIVPSLEFEVDDRSYQFREIEDELVHQRPAIAWLYISDAEGGCYHAAVVIGYDEVNQRIMLNDPLRGQISMLVGEFMTEWQRTEQMLIRVRLGDRLQRRITEYFEQPEVGGAM